MKVNMWTVRLQGILLLTVCAGCLVDADSVQDEGRHKRSAMSDQTAAMEDNIFTWLINEYNVTYSGNQRFLWVYAYTDSNDKCISDPDWCIPREPKYHRQALIDAYQMLDNETCISPYHVKTPRSATSVLFSDPAIEECFISVYNKQPTYLASVIVPEKCARSGAGSVMHVILHGLGYFHEHQRRDRDEFIKLNYANIGTSNRDKWEIRRKLNTIYVQPYDFNSLLHSGLTEGSKNGKPIFELQPDYKIYKNNVGQRARMSFRDAKAVNIGPYCDWRCFPRDKKGKWTQKKCYNGGYPDPMRCNECICPPGWRADSGCLKVAMSTGADCSEDIILSAGQNMDIKSPSDLNLGQTVKCNWHVKAPQGYNIELKFSGKFSVAHSTHQEGWVEVAGVTKGWMDMGPRFSGEKTPTETLRSFGRELMVTLRTTPTQHYSGFTAEVTAVKCSGDTCQSQPHEAYKHVWRDTVKCHFQHKRCKQFGGFLPDNGAAQRTARSTNEDEEELIQLNTLWDNVAAAQVKRGAK